MTEEVGLAKDELVVRVGFFAGWFSEDILEEACVKAEFDALVDGFGGVDGAEGGAVGVGEGEELVFNPRVVVGEIPREEGVFTASADFESPSGLGAEVLGGDDGHAAGEDGRACGWTEYFYFAEGGRLEGSGEVNEGGGAIGEIVAKADLGIDGGVVLRSRAVAIAEVFIGEFSFGMNGLESSN